MQITKAQQNKLLKLMANSAHKGNLANSAMVIRKEKEVASAESWVVSSWDATAHSERMLVSHVCQQMNTNFTPDLAMISVVEPCLMCLSACSQAGYSRVGYIIPAHKYVQQIPWMTDIDNLDKVKLASQFSSPVQLIHLNQYQQRFCKKFEELMQNYLS